MKFRPPIGKLSQILMASLIFSSTSAVALDDEEKLKFLNMRFNQAASDSKMWQYGWFGLFSGVATLNGIAYSQTEGPHNRYDRKVGFTTSFLGAADMLLNPMKTHSFAEQLRAMPESTAEQRYSKRIQAEAWMKVAAERERYEQSTLNHVLASVVNGLAGLAVAKDDGRVADGWMTFITGVVASEVKILSAPEHMMETEYLYNSGKLVTEAAKADAPRWEVAAFGPILSASYRF